MKKVLKSLLFVSSICVFASGASYFNDFSRQQIRNCMVSALEHKMVACKSDVGRLAQSLIREDLKEPTDYNDSVFSFSVYDEIYSDILQPIDEKYLEKEYECEEMPEEQREKTLAQIKKDRVRDFTNGVAEHYIRLAEDMYKQEVINIINYLECAYLKLCGSEYTDEKIAGILVKQDLDYFSKGDKNWLSSNLNNELKTAIGYVIEDYNVGDDEVGEDIVESFNEDCISAVIGCYCDIAKSEIKKYVERKQQSLKSKPRYMDWYKKH